MRQVEEMNLMQPFFSPMDCLIPCGVLIGFLGQFDVNVLNQMSDNKGCILILIKTIDTKKTLS